MTSPFRFVLAGAALLAAAGPLTASAQTRQPAAGARAAAPAGPPAATPHKVGLVDVGHIFSNYEKLKDLRKALEEEMKASDGQLKQYQEQIQAIQEQLKSGTVVKGSEQWTELEKQLVEINAKGQAEMSNLRREFIRKEVQMYKDIYDEVAHTVSLYAKGRNYTLILRYQREPADESAGIEDPNKIMSRVNQLVVYHQEGDDITDTVLGYMNAEYLKTAARPAAPAAPARN
ncbi:MAG TPA: OmpH family outer membrane protein [Planctomycetaceae bacterium]